MEDDTRDQNIPEASSATSKNHSSSGSSRPQVANASAFINKRSRGLGVVTPNACTECRKKRAKCNGQKPCSRCQLQKDVACVYEEPVHQSKESLRHEISQLHREQFQNNMILSALRTPNRREEIIARLCADQTREEVSDSLATPQTPGDGVGVVLPSSFHLDARPMGGAINSPLPTIGIPGIVPPTRYGPGPASGAYASVQKENYIDQVSCGVASQNQTQSTSSYSHPDVMQWMSKIQPHTETSSWLNQVLTPPKSSMRKVSLDTWTNATTDGFLVQHLLALYFSWEYPAFACLSKEHFFKDFDDGRHRYCSPILVNALLALGARFSSQPNTRTDPDNPHTSGNHFFEEFKTLFHRETSHHSLTTIQALGIISSREASHARYSESSYYARQSIRIAIEMGLHKVDDHGDADLLAVQTATFWGAFSLDQAWSLATGSLPQCSILPHHMPPKPAFIEEIDATLWVSYTEDVTPLRLLSAQPSNVRRIYKCFCELSELVHQILYILHSPDESVTSGKILDIYTQCLHWYDTIPEVIRLGHNFTPSVLVAHMYYQFTILVLFRPLIGLRIIGSSIIPGDVCLQAADAIQGLLRSYTQLYTLRRTPSIVPYIVLASSVMHLAIGAYTPSPNSTSPPTSLSLPSYAQGRKGSSDHAFPRRILPGTRPESGLSASPSLPVHNMRVAETISQGISDLTEMASCHRFAEQALHTLRDFAKQRGIKLNISQSGTLSEQGTYQLVRPQPSNPNSPVPGITEHNFSSTWGANGERILNSGGTLLTLEGLTDRQQQQQQPLALAMDMPAQFPRKNVPTSREDHSKDSTNPAAHLLQEVANTPPIWFEEKSEPMADTAKSIENILYWPFAMPDRSTVPTAHLLKEAGFELLL